MLGQMLFFRHAILVVASLGALGFEAALSTAEADFQAYLNQHEIVYRRPPRGGHDGMPIGNRVMAGMVYSEGGDYKILLAKDDLWDHRTLDYEIAHHGLTHARVLEKLEAGEADSLTTIPRNRFAEFWSERPVQRAPGWMPYPAPKVASWITVRTRDQQFIEQRLRLSNATVQTQFDKLRLRAHIPVGSDKNVLVLRIEPDGRQDLEIEIARPADPILETSPVFSIQDGRLQLRYEFPDGFSYAMAFRIADATPSITLAGESATLKCTGAKPVTLLASISTSRDGPNPTADAVHQLQEFDPVDARTRHDSYWKDFWSKSRIQLGDKFIENLWYFGLYQAGASFSPRYSGGLAGPYFVTEPSPWQNDLHEVNEAMKFYAVYAANHPELAEGYVETHWRMIPRVRENTKRFYGFDGVRFPHATAYTGDEREAQPTAFKFQYMQSGPGLVANVAWQHYRFARDDELLRSRLYPIIRGAAEFYANYVQRGDGGSYHIYPTFSPEQLPSVWCRDATMDLAAVRDCLTAALETSRVLGVDEDRQAKWQEILDKLAPYPRDERGILEFPGDRRDYLYGHPSISTCIHPFNQYDPRDSVYRDLILQTQDRLGLYDLATFNKAHLATQAAWMGMGQLAWDLLYDTGVCQYLKTSGFFAVRSVVSGNDQLKTNLEKSGNAYLFHDPGMALMMTVNEMLMQSHRGSIRVFPAVPDSFVAGFDGLRARDGFLVSARRTAEGVQWIEIVAERADVVRIDNPWPGEAAQLSLNGKIQRTVQDEQAIDVPMAAGQRLTLVPAGQTVTANVWPPTESTGPRRTIRTLREGLPPGVRNDPIRPRSKVAERCELWLGTPGTEHRILNKE
jgi:alpha-L-fucosidase 2